MIGIIHRRGAENAKKIHHRDTEDTEKNKTIFCFR